MGDFDDLPGNSASVPVTASTIWQVLEPGAAQVSSTWRAAMHINKKIIKTQILVTSTAKATDSVTPLGVQEKHGYHADGFLPANVALACLRHEEIVEPSVAGLATDNAAGSLTKVEEESNGSVCGPNLKDSFYCFQHDAATHH